MTRLKKTLARTPSSLPRLEQAFAGLTRERALSAATAAETERSRMEHLLLNREDTHTLSVYVANKPLPAARYGRSFWRAHDPQCGSGAWTSDWPSMQA